MINTEKSISQKFKVSKFNAIAKRTGLDCTPIILKVKISVINQSVYIGVKIGESIAKQMGWVRGTKIIPMQDNEDASLFMLVEGENGYKLKPDGGGARSLLLTFKSPSTIGIPAIKTKPFEVDYEILNGTSVIFSIRQ